MKHQALQLITKGDLIKLFNNQDNETLILKMKEIVPEYVSSNSVYEKLDKVNLVKSEVKKL